MTTSQNSIANPIETSSDWLLKIPSLSQQQSILVSPGGTGTVTSYSLVYDVYFPTNGSSGWMPFLQTDIGNSNDADIFGKASGESYGVGIGELSRHGETGCLEPYRSHDREEFERHGFDEEIRQWRICRDPADRFFRCQPFRH